MKYMLYTIGTRMFFYLKCIIHAYNIIYYRHASLRFAGVRQNQTLFTGASRYQVYTQAHGRRAIRSSYSRCITSSPLPAVPFHMVASTLHAYMIHARIRQHQTLYTRDTRNKHYTSAVNHPMAPARRIAPLDYTRAIMVNLLHYFTQCPLHYTHMGFKLASDSIRRFKHLILVTRYTR